MNTQMISHPSFSDRAVAGGPTGRRMRRWPWIAGAALVAVLASGFGLWWFVLKPDSPPPVSLDSALAGIGTADPASSPTVAATPSTAAASSWTLDTTVTNAQGTGSFAGFRINEQLVGIGAATAVGRTPAVEGTLTVSGTTLQAAQITVGLADITTNDSRRDDAVQRALATSRYPDATFVLSQPVSVGKAPADGERISVSATGDLTIRGVTKPVTIALDAQLQGGVLVVVGSAPVTLSDFGVTAPTAPIVASVDDHGVMEFQLYFKQS